MARTFLALFILTTLVGSCSPARKQFGQTVITPSNDTILSKQVILKIKSLNNNVFEPATFTGSNSIKINYRLFKPNPLAGNKRYPLVVVYHGSGRPVGTDNTAQLGALPKLFASPDIQRQYPAYVLAPQFPTRSSDYSLDTARGVLRSVPRPCLSAALQLIDSLKSSLHIDSSRIYVVGFSMGGSTAINSLSAKPGLFAAGISIAGIPQFDNTQALSSIPIWLIHGIEDTENPINSDERLYQELGSNVLFWKLAATTHDNIFTPQIMGKNLPKWLFKHRRK